MNCDDQLGLLESEVELTEALYGQAMSLIMLLPCTSVNENIIDVRMYPLKTCQTSLHLFLENRTCTCHLHWHAFELAEAVAFSEKGCKRTRIWMENDVVVGL